MSSEDHARYADWDGAYVLGALSRADRHAYEEHLEQCPRCRGAVAELAPMPGLLGQLREGRPGGAWEDLAAAEGPADAPLAPDAGDGTLAELSRRPTPPEPSLAPPAPSFPPPRPSLAPHDPSLAPSGPIPPPAPEAPLRPSPSRRRRRVLAGALAAAAVLLLAIALPLSLGDRDGGDVVTVRTTAADGEPAPMTVDVELAPTDWGTALTITCDYPPPTADAPYGGYGDAPPTSYALVVTSEDGTRGEVSSWQGVPGEVVTLEAGTAFDLADIASVQVVDPSGAVVLTGEVESA